MDRKIGQHTRLKYALPSTHQTIHTSLGITQSSKNISRSIPTTSRTRLNKIVHSIALPWQC